MPPAEHNRLWSYWARSTEYLPRLALQVHRDLLLAYIMLNVDEWPIYIERVSTIEPCVKPNSLVREEQKLGVMRLGGQFEFQLYAPVTGILREARAYSAPILDDWPHPTLFLLAPATERCPDGCEAIGIAFLLPDCSLLVGDAPDAERERDRAPAQGKLGPPRDGLLVEFELANDVGVILSDGEVFWFASGDVEGDLPRDMQGQRISFSQAIGQKARAGKVVLSDGEPHDADQDQAGSLNSREELARLKALVEKGELTMEDLSEAITRMSSGDAGERSDGTAP